MKSKTKQAKNKKAGSDIMLPRGYLSYSQRDLWQRNPDEYMRVYFNGGKSFSNSAMKYGTKVDDHISTGEDTDDEDIKALGLLVTRYDSMQHEIRTGYKGVEFFGKLDSFDTISYDFLDYKTGIVPWTQKRAEKSRQLKWYGALIYLKYGKLPQSKKGKIVWIETEKVKGTITHENGEVYPGEIIKATGRIEEYDAEICLGDITDEIADAYTTAIEISNAYKRHLGLK